MGLDDMIVFTEVCNKSFSIYNCFDMEFKLNNNDYFYGDRKHSCFE